jgi:hypothetical protein
MLRKIHRKIWHVFMRILIHSLLCVINLRLSACRPSFAEVACTIYKDERARDKIILEIFFSLIKKTTDELRRMKAN